MQQRAQRTLVKSPPELWAELSHEPSLARRLRDFGEIRITRVDPESAIAWEGARASGTVAIEAAGWGTRVVLTATAAAAEMERASREPAAEAVEPVADTTKPVADAAEPIADTAEPVAEAAEPIAGAAEPDADAAQSRADAVEPTGAAVAEAVVETPQVPPRPLRRRRTRRLLARLLGRRRPVALPPAPQEPAPPAALWAGVPEPEPAAVPEPEPAAAQAPAPSIAIAPPAPVREMPAITIPPALDPIETEAILTAVLDDLGADHRQLYTQRTTDSAARASSRDD